eukprot:6807995-Alexandrium_andersonii.AAC.1
MLMIMFEIVSGARVTPDTSLQATVLAPRSSVGQLAGIFARALKHTTRCHVHPDDRHLLHVASRVAPCLRAMAFRGM